MKINRHYRQQQVHTALHKEFEAKPLQNKICIYIFFALNVKQKIFTVQYITPSSATSFHTNKFQFTIELLQKLFM